MKETRTSLKDILVVLVLYPFFYPKGFSEYFSEYKLFFTLWLLCSMVYTAFMLVGFLVRASHRMRWGVIFVAAYHLFLLFNTVMIQGTINDGFQKIICAPFLVYLCYILIVQNAKRFVERLSDILIFNFILSLTVFSQFVFRGYFNDRITFLGHIQVSAQLGILGMVLAYLLYHFMKRKKKAKVLAVLSVVVMFVSLTSVAFICLFVIGGLWIFQRRFKLAKRVLCVRTEIISILAIAGNGLALTLLDTGSKVIRFLGVATTLNGRSVIWTTILGMLEGHWLNGYGAYGAVIKVYWYEGAQTAAEMFYGHNEILQLLLDGGIVLVILFVLMQTQLVSSIRYANNKKVVRFANICFIAFSAIMIAEAVTEYYYFLAFLTLIGTIPEIERQSVE